MIPLPVASLEGPGRRFVNKAPKKSGQAWGQSTAISALSEAQAQTEVTLSWLSETASPAFKRRAASSVACFSSFTSSGLGPSSPRMQRISRRASKRQSFWTSCLRSKAPPTPHPSMSPLKPPLTFRSQAALRGRPQAAPRRAGPGPSRRSPGPHLKEDSADPGSFCFVCNFSGLEGVLSRPNRAFASQYKLPRWLWLWTSRTQYRGKPVLNPYVSTQNRPRSSHALVTNLP